MTIDHSSELVADTLTDLMGEPLGSHPVVWISVSNKNGGILHAE